MASTDEFLIFLDEHSAQYFEAVNPDQKQDAVNTPYQSHYKSREIFKALLVKLEELVKLCKNPDCKRALAVLHFKLGINHVETEEASTGEVHFKQCRTVIDDCEMDVIRNTGIKQELLNQFGLLYSQRDDLEKGLECLLEAKVLYLGFNKDAGRCPWSTDDFFRREAYNDEQNEKQRKARTDTFEDNYTLTLYYVAQVYGKLENVFDSAEYCKETLKRQLCRHKYEPLDWSMNAATLSQFYITNHEYSTARHCLASAEIILKEFGEKPASLFVDVNEDDSQETINRKEKLPKAWADLYRCWIKYSISLLEYSAERLTQNAENYDLGKVPREIRSEETEEEIFNLELASVEGHISAGPVLVFDEAREVFKCCQTWINSAKEFYVLDGHCSDHVELIRDSSCLFKHLAFFELDLPRQCKMHKRRADMLSEILHKLNSQYYLGSCHQLSFEIGEIYSAMLDNKLALLEIEAENSKLKWSQAANKINSLAKKGVEYFQTYLKYLRNPEGKLPNKFQEESERPALIAHFYCGRLYSKLMTDNLAETLQNTKLSFECYSYLVEYCKSNPTAVEKVKEESSACEEMISLLPAKMDRIRSQMDA